MGEVAGIAFSGDKMEAEVQFNLKVDNLSPFAYLDEAAACGMGPDLESELGPDNLLARKVKMRLFDDGWRLVEK
jgi:hypothetical protein